MSQALDSIRAMRGDLRRVLGLRFALWGLAGWGFVWGTGVLVFRAAGLAGRGAGGWGALGAVVVLIGAVVMAVKRTPSREAVRAILDHESRCGGLLIAAGEVEIGEWARGMGPVRRPRVRWRAGRSWAVLGAACAFVAMGFALPDRMVRPRAVNGLAGPAERLEQQVERLQKQQIITPADAKRLTAQLESLRQQPGDGDPAKGWEAMDEVTRELRRLADAAAEKSVAQMQRLAQAESLATALAQNPAKDPQQTAAAMAALGRMIAQLRAEDAKARAALEQAGIDERTFAPTTRPLRQLLVDRHPDAATMAAIVQRMATMKIDARQLGRVDDRTLETLKEAVENGKIDEALRGPLAGVAKNLERGDVAALSDAQVKELGQAVEDLGVKPDDYLLLEERQSEAAGGAGARTAKLTEEQKRNLRQVSGVCEAGRGADREALQRMIDEGLIDPSRLKQAESATGEHAGPPGRGGIDRGGATAAMTWSDPTSEKGMKFKERALPPGEVNVRDSRQVGIGATAPQRTHAGVDDSGSLAGAKAGGGSANVQAILPEHRAAVTRYFQRSNK